MAQPSEKALSISTFLSSITGRDWKGTIQANRCITCGGDASEFKDPLSAKEYTISGMCQICQDATFGA